MNCTLQSLKKWKIKWQDIWYQTWKKNENDKRFRIENKSKHRLNMIMENKLNKTQHDFE